MPRFTFHRRKSTANDDIENAKIAAPPSFRVLDRNEVSTGKPFDGGARAGRPHPIPAPAPSYRAESLPEPEEENMFSVLKAKDRGSGSSNTTKTMSTDNSSRLSDISSAPSSADLHEDTKPVPRKQQYAEIPVPPIPKSPSSGFFKNASRTFSFGNTKKASTPPTSPDARQSEWREGDDSARFRVITASTPTTSSTPSTATPPRLEEGDLDMGNEFGTNMFKGLAEKRSSMHMQIQGDFAKSSKSLADSRPVVPAPLQIDKSTRVEPSPNSWNSQSSNDKLLSSPPPVPRHWDSKPSPGANARDDDSTLLTDSLLASRWLGGNPAPVRGRLEPIPQTEVMQSRPSPFQGGNSDGNLFASVPASMRPAHRFPPKPVSAQNKVMTPAQFEQYRMDKERQGTLRNTEDRPDSDNEEDNYDYDDEEDQEKARKATKERNKARAHMTLYRQQMTKVVGEANPSSSPPSLNLPGFSSTPNLLKAPSPELVLASDEDEDEDIPLGILSAHNFPSKSRPPTRPTASPNQHLRASYVGPSARSPSSLGGGDPQRNNRHSALPAFARNLPQDPFIGAGIAQPQIREALPFGGGSPNPQSHMPGGQVPVGGLVGVIMNEERSRAMRRGSPQPQAGKFGGSPLLGYDPALNMHQQMMPGPHMMYGMNPVAAMSQPTLSLSQPAYGQPAQSDMMQMQMQMQLMQMQMAQMNMMQGAPGQMAPGMQSGQMSQESGSLMRQSVSDVTLGANARHSVATDSLREQRPRMDAGLRTMSMVQPSSASWIQPAGYAPSIRIQGSGYTPSIAPSERSNIGMPGRYRPVSQAIPSNDARRISTMSGALGGWDAPAQRASKSEPRLSTGAPSHTNSGSVSDDDDEGWEALRAKREKTKSMWKSKKSTVDSNDAIFAGIL